MLLIAALSTIVLLLWSPATSFARDTARAEQGKSFQTALVAAGLLRRGAGYGTGHGSTAVRQLQLRLRTRRFHPGPIDGLFGPLTQRAVERFQTAHGLRADGMVGPETRTFLLRPKGRESKPVRSSRPDRERAAPGKRTADRPPAVDVAPDRPVTPDTRRAPSVPARPQPSDGLAPEVAAGLGALAMAVLLGGAWLLGGRRRRGTSDGDEPERDRTPATNLRLGMVCASLLAVFAMGAAAGALFATHASPGERETGEARGTAAMPDVTRAGDAGVAVRLSPQRSPSSP